MVNSGLKGLIRLISRFNRSYWKNVCLKVIRFANVRSQFKQIRVVFTHLEWCVALARHNFIREN